LLGSWGFLWVIGSTGKKVFLLGQIPHLLNGVSAGGLGRGGGEVELQIDGLREAPLSGILPRISIASAASTGQSKTEFSLLKIQLVVVPLRAEHVRHSPASFHEIQATPPLLSIHFSSPPLTRILFCYSC